MLVVGSPNSSNSNRLREVSEVRGTPAYLIDGPEDLDCTWLKGVKSIGLTAGASAPEVLVQDVIAALRRLTGAEVVEMDGQRESHVFPLPKSLQA